MVGTAQVRLCPPYAATHEDPASPRALARPFHRSGSFVAWRTFQNFCSV